MRPCTDAVRKILAEIRATHVQRVVTLGAPRSHNVPVDEMARASIRTTRVRRVVLVDERTVVGQVDGCGEDLTVERRGRHEAVPTLHQPCTDQVEEASRLDWNPVPSARERVEPVERFDVISVTPIGDFDALPNRLIATEPMGPSRVEISRV